MSAKNILLFANMRPGLEICEYLVSSGENIVKLYLTNFESENSKKIMDVCSISNENIHLASEIKNLEHIKQLQKISIDYLITVYWPYLIKSEVFNQAKSGTVNFHPALLPHNRGWYPQVHNILDGSPAGVTLHSIDENADTGPIWAQKKVIVDEIDTAKTLHEKLQNEIIQLFKEKWPEIKKGKITLTLQEESKAKYHKKLEVDEFDYIDFSKDCKIDELLRLLRARSFGDKGFAYILKNDKKIYLNLRLSYNNNF
jgi:methionyl-tRNA formyltransferase